MTVIRINELERNTSPSKTDLLPLDNDNTGTRSSTIEEVVGTVMKKANTAEASLGTNAEKYMTPETTKLVVDEATLNKFIAANTRILTSSDLEGGGAIIDGLTIRLSTNTLNLLEKANTAVQPAQLALKLDKPSGGNANNLIRGDGSVVTSNTFVLQTQLTSYSLKTETSLKLDKPTGGTANNIIKGDGTIVDIDTFATADQGTKADNSLQIGSQILTDNQKSQIRNNIETDFLGSYRNKIINGHFYVAQRGTSFFSNGPTIDQWRLGVGISATCSINRVVTPVADISTFKLPGGNVYHAEWQRTTAGTSESIFSNRIEGVRQFAGRKATLTFYAKALAPTTITPKLEQYFGSGGSTPNIYTSFPSVNLTTEWQKFTAVVNVPSIEGKNVETGNYLNLYFGWLHTAPNTTISLARVSLVDGDATMEYDPFSERHPALETLMCQRYLYIPASQWANAIGGDNGYRRLNILFPTIMRVIPTVAFSTTPSSGVTVTGTNNQFLSTSGISIAIDLSASTGYVNVSNIVFSSEL